MTVGLVASILVDFFGVRARLDAKMPLCGLHSIGRQGIKTAAAQTHAAADQGRIRPLL